MNEYSCFSEAVKQWGTRMTCQMMILNDMNDTEDAHGEVTLMKLRVGVNRLGRPKTYFLCFWCKLMMSSELLWKSSAVSGTFPKGEVDIEAVYAV